MNNKQADVSVVIPLYNHERYVVEALESVFQQSVRPREIIVVDDGSTDRSCEMVRKHFGAAENLVLWSKPNGGAHHAINAGIYRATSKNVAILNSDDLYAPERLQVCLELLAKHENADMVATGITFVDGSGRNISNEWYRQAYEYYLRHGDLALSLINGNFLMTTSNFVVRRTAFEKYGYFGKFRYAHDLAFLLRVLAQGGMIHVHRQPLLQYRIHDSNTIKEGVLKVKVELAAVVAEYIVKLYHTYQDGTGIDHLNKLYSILDAHNLSRMLFPLIAALAARPCNHDGIDDLLADDNFTKFMLTIAK